MRYSAKRFAVSSKPHIFKSVYGTWCYRVNKGRRGSVIQKRALQFCDRLNHQCGDKE